MWTEDGRDGVEGQEKGERDLGEGVWNGSTALGCALAIWVWFAAKVPPRLLQRRDGEVRFQWSGQADSRPRDRGCCVNFGPTGWKD